MRISRLTLSVVLALGWCATGVFAASVFRLEPPGTTNEVGTTFTFSLSIPEGEHPYAFRWRKDGTVIPGAEAPSLTTTNAQLTDSGTYSLSYSNQVGTNVVQETVSATAYIVHFPEIYEPIRMSASGSSITFAVEATGGLLSYQWTWQGYDLPGATRNVLTFPDAYAHASAGYYAVRVSNPAGTNSSAGEGLLFTKPTPAGTYVGLFQNPDLTAVESIGYFRYTISSSKRSFSGQLLRGTSKYRLSGTFSEAHDTATLVRMLSGGTLTNYMQLVTTNDTPVVIGSVDGGSWRASLYGTRLAFSAKNPTPLAGRYTLAFQNTNMQAGVPNGHGYGTVLVRKDGSVAFSGGVPDGTSVSQSSGLSRLGEWPLHCVSHQGRGRLAGWLRVQKQAGSSIRGGPALWLKTPSDKPGKDKRYPGDIKLLLQPTGSTYAPVTNATFPVMTGSNWVANLYGGDLFSGEDATFDLIKTYLRPPTSFKAEPGYERFKLSVNKSTGVLQGSVKHVITGKSAPIRGVVLQQQSMGRGYFLSTNTAGAFALTPATPVN